MADEPAETAAPAATADPPKDPPKVDEPDPPKDPPKEPDTLGDAGKAAIAAERKRAADAEKRAKVAEAALRKREEADMSEQERAVAQAREEGKNEVTTTFQKRLLNAEIRARAAGKFANPDIALKLVDLGDEAFDGTGEINVKAINDEIDRLLKAEPYLKAGAGNGGGRPAGDADAGKGGHGNAGRSMNDLIRGSRSG